MAHRKKPPKCTGCAEAKSCYPTPEAAAGSSVNMLGKLGRTRVYWCEPGQAWHLTTRVGRKHYAA